MDRPQGRTGSDIRNIVHLVQSGKLKRGEGIPVSSEQETPLSAREDESVPFTVNSQSSNPRWTTEKRQEIIQQLLEKRRLARDPTAAAAAAQAEQAAQHHHHQEDRSPVQESEPMQEEESPVPDTDYHRFPEEYVGQTPGSFDYLSSQSYDNDSYQRTGRSSGPVKAWGAGGASAPRQRSSSASRPQQQPQQRERSRSASRSHKQESLLTLSGERPSRAADDSAVGDARMHRIAQTEAAIAQEMFKECTFAPKINHLPRNQHRQSSAADEGTPFYDRAARWLTTKQADVKKKKESLEQVKSSDCTFTPKINRNSIRSVKELRGDTGDVSTRLYHGSEEMAMMKAKFIEEEKRREQEAEARQCTFKPQIVTDPTKYSYVAPKYKTAETKPAPAQDELAAKECTFTPKVKGVRPHMSSAKLYLSTNVVDRLCRPITGEHGREGHIDESFDNDRPVMDMASFMNSLHGGGGGGVGGGGSVASAGNASGTGTGTRYATPSSQRPSSAGASRGGGGPVSSTGKRPLSSGGRGGGGGTPGMHISAEEKEKRRDQFDQFLGRQEQSLKRRERNIKEVTQQETPGFKPALCPNSLHIAKQNSQEDFLDRMEKSVLKRSDSEVKRRGSYENDEYTFKPKITEKSEKLRARTVFEMSRGDLIKLENKKNNIRLRVESEEKMDMPFKPEITQKARGKQSVLRINDDPGSHLDWYKTKVTQKDMARNEALRRREEDEMAQCTFTPATRECPTYIAKIAASMDAIHKARGPVTAVAQDSKPTWR